MSAQPRAAARLRVLMIGPLPPPVGGMATVVANLATALPEHCELRILDNVKTTSGDRHLLQGIAAQLRLLARLLRWCLLWRPHLVHIHTCSWFSFWRSGVDLLIARLCGCRVILHIHGGHFQRFLDGLSPALAWLARRLFAQAQCIIVLGSGWKQLLDAWAAPARVRVLPNAVPIPTIKRVAPAAGFRILCLAGYEPLKGQADLLQAVARLGLPVGVDLLGAEAVPGYRAELQRLAADLGLAERVNLPGPVTGAAKEAYLEAAACLCLPSYDEGLPMSILEAMAAGLPVVATRVGAIPEAVTEGEEGLLFAPGDIAALSAHLACLIQDPARAAAIARAGQARVQRDFGLAQGTQRLLEIYRQVTAGH